MNNVVFMKVSLVIEGFVWVRKWVNLLVRVLLYIFRVDRGIFFFDSLMCDCKCDLMMWGDGRWGVGGNNMY